MAAPVGRPTMEATEKKRKLHVSVDPEIYDFLQTLENKSEFINKAAWVLLRAYQKVNVAGGEAT